MKQFLISLLAVMLVSSCIPHRKLINYQENYPATDTQPIANQPDIQIQANDVLSIQVFSPDEKTVAPFNVVRENQGNIFDTDAIQLDGYLVGQDGTISFPELGDISVKGLKIGEVKELIARRLDIYLKNPVVVVRLINFKITVSGEVTSEGSFNVFNERITLPEAIARAGGLTDYANRQNILLVREVEGVRSYERIDLLSADVFRSDYFYLKQNDLIYVEPIRAKTGAINDQTSKTIPIITAAATVIAVIISILASN
ncbi:MAG: polysaccharide biosynthesis/export family protein [Saprospiraceae bacterium]